ncbi:hypothetical protein B296_00053208 [Ensete ventricosum]|uniref:Uncharacterized protein n=1 Tax=Ensete ventricosum TaxID=4639 RepID=A0A426Y966_ENSVE|nr:hypothetical protein B296_00053208 [Ensete ventricosum]
MSKLLAQREGKRVAIVAALRRGQRLLVTLAESKEVALGMAKGYKAESSKLLAMTTISPCGQEVVSHGQALYKGGWPRPGRLQPRLPARGRLDARRWPPAGAVAAHGHGRLWPACKGSRLQGAHKGLSPAVNPTASRSSDVDRRGGRPLVGQLPVGKGRRRQCRGGGGGAMKVNKG